MPNNLTKVLVIGSGPIIIGQPLCHSEQSEESKAIRPRFFIPLASGFRMTFSYQLHRERTAQTVMQNKAQLKRRANAHRP